MADATDLKSVGLKRPVPVRVRPSAPSTAGVASLLLENRSGVTFSYVKRSLLLGVLTVFGITTGDAGIYQRTRYTHVRVWNDQPTSFQEVTWSGGKDEAGYATGYGTVTWLAPEKPPTTGSSLPSRRKMVVVRTATGTMERGKLVNAKPTKPKSQPRAPRDERSPAPESSAEKAPASTPAKETSPTPSPSATPAPTAAAPASSPSPSPSDQSINSLTRPPSSLQLSSPPPTESPSPSP
jgi:hypothetical protein